MEKKIDERKLDDASKKLSTIIATAGEFNELYKQLNQQERALIGSLVISVESHWEVLDMNGFVGMDSTISHLINKVVSQFNQYMQQKQTKPQENQLTRAVLKPNETKIN